MASYYSFCIFILLLFFLCISKSGGLELKRVKTKPRKSGGLELKRVKTKPRKLDETINQPITNPANLPPYTPTIVTVPGTNPTISPINPIPTTTPTTTVPTTTTPTQPITNPANPGGAPVVYPVNQPTPPTTITNTPASVQGQGQTWCIAKTGAPENSLQDALDYACGIGGADCSMIQEGGSCYNPNSLENHASFAFNSYYQKNPSPTSCDFGGVAVLVNTNPSSGTCNYPSSGSQAAVPLTTNPPTTQTPSSTIPTPTTFSPGTNGSPPFGVLPSGTYGSPDSPPSMSTPSNPNSLFPASYGPDSPPSVNSVPAGSAVLQPSFDLIVLVAFFTGKLFLGI